MQKVGDNCNYKCCHSSFLPADTF